MNRFADCPAMKFDFPLPLPAFVQPRAPYHASNSHSVIGKGKKDGKLGVAILSREYYSVSFGRSVGWSVRHITDLYRLDLEVQRYQREHERLQVLHEIVEDAESLRISRFLDVDEGANLGGFEGDVFVSQADLEFLTAVFILLRPFCIIFLHNLGLLDDALDLLDHEGAHAHLFADERVVTVIRIVGVTGHRTATVTEHSEVELQELMAEAAAVAGVIPKVELLVFGRHGWW